MLEYLKNLWQAILGRIASYKRLEGQHVQLISEHRNILNLLELIEKKATETSRNSFISLRGILNESAIDTVNVDKRNMSYQRDAHQSLTKIVKLLSEQNTLILFRLDAMMTTAQKRTYLRLHPDEQKPSKSKPGKTVTLKPNVHRVF